MKLSVPGLFFAGNFFMIDFISVSYGSGQFLILDQFWLVFMIMKCSKHFAET